MWYIPTSASITVSRGAAGKAIVVFISNICNKSTERSKTLISECE